MPNVSEGRPLEKLAVGVQQPLGTFYAFCMSADDLLKITYSQPAEVIERLEAEGDDRGGYSIFGTQRGESKKRLREIASFIQTTEATFPNAIILAANYDQDGRYIEEEAARWRVSGPKTGPWCLHIPSSTKRSASIIDGQHRLHAFEMLPPGTKERQMELLCVVFLELPTPYHAYVFATINFNQKKVDRSLAYELFGFDVDERPAKYWSPETLAVYLARMLNTDEQSPLYRSIFPTAESPKLFSEGGGAPDSRVQISMATIVDGILRLISKNPKRDRNTVRRVDNKDAGRKSLSAEEGLPLREFYLNGNDKGIYEIVFNYFMAVRKTIWEGAGEGSYLVKTVGLQALFDILKVLLSSHEVNSTNFSLKSLISILKPCANLDPKGDKYQASGIGRADIRRDLLSALKPSKLL